EERHDVLSRDRPHHTVAHDLRVVPGAVDRLPHTLHGSSLSRPPQWGIVSSTAAGRRRTNQSERGSATGSTRARAVRTVQWSAPARTSDRSSDEIWGTSCCSWATREIRSSTGTTSTTSEPR